MSVPCVFPLLCPSPLASALSHLMPGVPLSWSTLPPAHLTPDPFMYPGSCTLPLFYFEMFPLEFQSSKARFFQRGSGAPHSMQTQLHKPHPCSLSPPTPIRVGLK